jgi:hypothetical protein
VHKFSLILGINYQFHSLSKYQIINIFLDYASRIKMFSIHGVEKIIWTRIECGLFAHWRRKFPIEFDQTIFE